MNTASLHGGKFATSVPMQVPMQVLLYRILRGIFNPLALLLMRQVYQCFTTSTTLVLIPSGRV
jgi:hypothetical protein